MAGPAASYMLKVFDCYRPQPAVDHFVRRAKDPADEKMKVEFFSEHDGYIAEESGHSLRSTVGLTIMAPGSAR
ncbi:hypothetical protein NQK81_19605 [Amycolatopsis roodepoortensis]|uniref:hypothetical protein n=1 Tax=Amycolatopsis roodepoortensis TaxID=700274 RepID=UPI00214B4CE8|nr:hypothetical protein [Amycolatopsis roodepoortensis]UUV35558.1 hypothetical protein NQK81_19605 [Amycolatopsis roodepoortensis]